MYQLQQAARAEQAEEGADDEAEDDEDADEDFDFRKALCVST